MDLFTMFATCIIGFSIPCGIGALSLYFMNKHMKKREEQLDQKIKEFRENMFKNN